MGLTGFWCSCNKPIAWPNSCKVVLCISRAGVELLNQPKFIVGCDCGTCSAIVPIFDHAPCWEMNAIGISAIPELTRLNFWFACFSQVLLTFIILLCNPSYA